MRPLVMLSVFMAVLLVGDCLQAEAQDVRVPKKPQSLLAPGQPAPAFVSRDAQGKAVALREYLGHPVILNFWATWCAPCRQEMRVLQATYEVHKAAGLAVLAVSQDAPDSAGLVSAYWASMALTFVPLLDPEGSVATDYSVFVLPSTVFIHPSGTVAAVHLGALTQTQMERYLSTIMPQAG